MKRKNGYVDALTVECPQCKAAPGKKCSWKRDNQGRTHLKRRELADPNLREVRLQRQRENAKRRRRRNKHSVKELEAQLFGDMSTWRDPRYPLRPVSPPPPPPPGDPRD